MSHRFNDMLMDATLMWLLAGFLICLVGGMWGWQKIEAARARREAELAEERAQAKAEARAKREAARQAAQSDPAIQSVAQALAQAQAEAQARAARARAANQALAQASAQDVAARQAAAHQKAAEEAARAASARAQAAAAATARQQPVAATPSAPARPAVSALAPPVKPSAPKPPEQTTVMIADDSKVVRIKTGRLLAQHQYRVALATDGLDAVQQMQSKVPDVVIVDVEMPGMDGFELTRHLRGNPRTAGIPIIMITSADDVHREDAKRCGVDVLMGKPYQEDALIAHIRKAMSGLRRPSAAMA